MRVRVTYVDARNVQPFSPNPLQEQIQKLLGGEIRVPLRCHQQSVVLILLNEPLRVFNSREHSILLNNNEPLHFLTGNQSVNYILLPFLGVWHVDELYHILQAR